MFCCAQTLISDKTNDDDTSYFDVFKDIKIRCVLVIGIITDRKLGTTKPSILSVNNRQVEAQYGNLALAYSSNPQVLSYDLGHSNSPTKFITLQKSSLQSTSGIS